MAIETLGAALKQINRLVADGTVTGFSDAQLLERFTSGHHAAAFEALVAHHGPMVLGVCRGILHDPNDAEDAFQATFLILVKKSSTLRRQGALGPWLYRVAHRVAIRANAAAARRRACERRAGQMASTASPAGPAAPDDQLQALHEEIALLPEKLRQAIVLCDLQSAPQVRAARELRLSERTLQRRLSEGRARLKARLTRRGLAPEGGVLGSAFLRAVGVAVPPTWSQATVQAALASVDHSITIVAGSAAAQKLTQEVLRMMVVQKLTMVTATLLAGGLIAWRTSAVLVTFGNEPSQNFALRANSALQRKDDADVPRSGPNSLHPSGKVPVRGRVLAPDGQTVPGAKLYRTPAIEYHAQRYLAREDAMTGRDGRFQFVADRMARLTLDYQRSLYERTVVAAAAPNYGVGWLEVPPGGRSDDLTIQLVDDQPITGQVLDLEGKPVPGANLQVLEIRAAVGENLGPWLEAARGKKGLSDQLEQQYLSRVTIAPALKFTADAEGRFRLTGIGRNRLVTALLDGPTIVSQRLKILTRPGETLNVQRYLRPPGVTTTYYSATFRHAAAPTKPIFGVVRDADTKKPLAGVTISADRPIGFMGIVSTTTNAQGRYRLLGMPSGEKISIKATPSSDQPYVISLKPVSDSLGLEPVQADIELRRGVWIQGRITNKVTGKAVLHDLSYFAQPDNPNLSAYGYGRDGIARAVTNEDGSYRLAGMPGPGMIAVHAADGYLRADDRDDEFGTREILIPAIGIPTLNYSAVAGIDPARGVELVERDVTLDPGWTFTGTVLGPDGKPLAGSWGLGLSYSTLYIDVRSLEVMKTAEFTVSEFNPHKPRTLLFQHPQKGLVGVAQPPKNKGESITVQLRPGATVTGRLVDADGQPRAGVELVIQRHHKKRVPWGEYVYFPPPRNKTDQRGQFRIEGLLPGYEFALVAEGKDGSLPLGAGLHSGETEDLGDVKIGNE
jgi:RNA polymerase sigma factor (sigma-70 family)